MAARRLNFGNCWQWTWQAPWWNPTTAWGPHGSYLSFIEDLKTILDFEIRPSFTPVITRGYFPVILKAFSAPVNIRKRYSQAGIHLHKSLPMRHVTTLPAHKSTTIFNGGSCSVIIPQAGNAAFVIRRDMVGQISTYRERRITMLLAGLFGWRGWNLVQCLANQRNIPSWPLAATGNHLPASARMTVHRLYLNLSHLSAPTKAMPSWTWKGSTLLAADGIVGWRVTKDNRLLPDDEPLDAFARLLPWAPKILTSVGTIERSHAARRSIVWHDLDHILTSLSLDVGGTPGGIWLSPPV